MYMIQLNKFVQCCLFIIARILVRYRVRLLSPVFSAEFGGDPMMKRFALAACAALVAAATAMPSFAADLPPPAYKAQPSPYYVAPFSWSGFYVGINGGYGFGTSNWTATGLPVSTGNFDLKGAVAGGTLGYNLQTGAWVWGIEGDFDYSWIKGTETTTCGGPGCETQNNWLATGRLRVGYAWDRWLPYITGGAAGGNIKLGGGGLGTESKNQNRLDGGRRARIRLPWRLVGQARISLC
jgi:outer membrane immunogenic protein